MSSSATMNTSSSTTCGSLLRELQEIWDEIGESDGERDKMLFQLEKECLDIYRRKVEKTRMYKADLQQSLVDAEAEISKLVSVLGESAYLPQLKGTLKEQVSALSPVLEDLRRKKQERLKEFSETEYQIVRICAEIAGSRNPAEIQVNESDLTIKRLGDLKSHLHELQAEKNLRLQNINNHINAIHELSIVMSLDFKKTVEEIHPSFLNLANAQSKNISNETLARLTSEVNNLKQEKERRLQKLQDLGSTLIELWSLMDTPLEERNRFDHVTSLISSSINNVSYQGCLAISVLEQVEVEVQRLNTLKASKMKELILRRQDELEEIYRGVHMEVDSETARQILSTIMESGSVELSDLLSNMDDQIAKAKEEALSRKEILDKVEKWKHASEEEIWLDEYERDDNRYSAGRGAHKNLKRAEKARILVSKIPSLVENLTSKVKSWEMEKGMPFLYDKAPLLPTLDEYNIQRQQKEEEKRRSREQRRLQEQFAVEQEARFGSRPTVKKPLGQSTNSNVMVGTPISRRVSTPARQGISGGKDRRDSTRVGNIIPANYVAIAKDDQVSRGS